MLFHELVNRVWKDAEFKAQLLDDARACLKQLGIDWPAGVNIRFHENSAGAMHLVMPERTADGDPMVTFGTGLGGVLERMRDDADFAARLHDGAQEAIAEVTGTSAPAGIRLIVHRDGPNLRNFVIPLNPGVAELDEINRHIVAGSMLRPRPGR